MADGTPASFDNPSLSGSVVLDAARRCVQINGREVFITATQTRIFAILHAAAGQPVGRAELISRGIGTRVTERTVDVHVKELRRKRGPYGGCIRTVRGMGYTFEMTTGD